MLARAFCRYNPELFREDVTEALVKKGMMKTVAIVESGMPLDKRPNIVEDRIRNYRKWRKYCRSIHHQNLKLAVDWAAEIIWKASGIILNSNNNKSQIYDKPKNIFS